MLLNLLSASLLDGAGCGDDAGPFNTQEEDAGFPRGVLASYAWEGWWQEEPVKVSTPDRT